MPKKIAIMTTENVRNIESIINYFKDKDVNLTCLTDNVNSPVLEKAKSLGIAYKYLPPEQNTQYLASQNFDLIVLSHYKSALGKDTLKIGKFINIHSSLLPSFKGTDEINRAYLAGVKVSGVTIHWETGDIDGGKIIAQYPVLIGNTTHIDEFTQDIYNIEDKLYPPVIEAIVEDKVFDFQDLFQNSCQHNSSGCGGNCQNCNG